MSGIILRLKKGIGRLPKGSSKMFGSPDVWPGFEWPAITGNGECYDLHFIGQINCAEASACDKEDMLPTNGILYFFYDFSCFPADTTNKNAARVIYHNGSIDTLRELMMVDEDGLDCAISPPQPVSFAKPNKSALVSKLMMCTENEETEGRIALLTINSFSVICGDVKFNGLGKMHFLVEKEKLERLDFSDIRIKHIYN